MKEHWHNDWQHIFGNNNFSDFNSIWDLKTEWFEEPNIRRGGWSGVVKINLNTPQGEVGVFIKRQQNHITKTPLHPIKGKPTFEREYKNILRLRKNNIPTLDPVYFAKRNHNGHLQAILITKELRGYVPLDSEHFLQSGDLIKNASHKNHLLTIVAETLRSMHNHHFQHNCLYLKHIFIKPNGDTWDIKIIDLEKLKKTIFKRSSVFRDLYTISRHSIGWTTKDYITFFRAYFQEKRLSDKSKSLWRSIAKKIVLKRR